MRRWPAYCLLLVLAGCGGEPEPPLPTNSKTVPTVEETYQRRSLTTWRALAGGLSAEERAAQAWALGVLEKDPLASLDVLLRLLADEDDGVRLAAVVAVGRLAPPSPRAARAMVALLDAEAEPLRRHARIALGSLGAHAAGALAPALDSPRLRVRWAAVESLGRIGAPAESLAGRLENAAREDEHEAVRRQARFSLPRMGAAGLSAALRLMRAADAPQRAELAAALAHAGPAEVPRVAGLLGDADEDLAARAAGVLADMGTDALPALEALVAALGREGPVRFNAAEALRALGEPARAPMERLAAGEDEDLAAIARYVLDGL